MTMMYLSRNIAHAVLLLAVVATNNVVQVQAACAIDAECEYGTSCLTFNVQLICNAPSDAVSLSSLPIAGPQKPAKFNFAEMY